MRGISSAAGIILALATGSVLAGGTTPAGAAAGNWTSHGTERAERAGAAWGRSLDSASSAQPSAARPEVRDTSQDLVHVSGGPAKADALAAASAACDGCSGDATTLQVAYFDGGKGTAAADNVASAWATCAGCSASAVSVQIVLVPRRGAIDANNRAIAVNASCAGCSTSAAALQFVLASGPRRQLSAAAAELVGQARAQLAERLESAARKPNARTAKTDARSAAAQTARQLEQIIAKDLGTVDIRRQLDVQVGS
ncbi:hypothetical protein LVY72_00870 [Arthrobacter sp. I2-34]|uniref:Uncharacterized protein n=1 Tax=Arthrobacter hankyongi TaxID=2904801 RepID=A0ABS9L1B5_9MICC|nr:hypothetical protein [Arthrobacter hankyongi]MCG2620460.1 hypothetical protein [Arthrobacter hankyongi]